MQKLVPPLLACLLAASVAGAFAQSIWKWRDANGQIHISDMAPPPGTPVKTILQRPNGLPAPQDASADGGTPPSAPAPTGTDADLVKKKAQADKAKADADAAQKARVDQQNAAARAENCANAQQMARTMQSGQRVAQINANGEREFLDDATIAARNKKAQDAIGQYCGAAKGP